jgi:DNA repair protein RecO (recombination protein O)
MPLRQTPAIVLSVRPYGEADLMVSFLTPKWGRLTGVAKHARKSRRRFAHALEPLSRVDFTLSGPGDRELEFIQKGELVRIFPGLRRDLPRLGAAAVLAELAGTLAAPAQAAPEIFITLEEALALLEAGGFPDSLLPAFILHLLALGGYGPRWEPCLDCGQEPAPPLYFSAARGGMVCGPCSRTAREPLFPLDPGTWKSLKLAQSLPRAKLANLRFTLRARDQGLGLLKLFLRHHLGRDLKSWAFWEKVGAGGGG